MNEKKCLKWLTAVMTALNTAGFFTAVRADDEDAPLYTLRDEGSDEILGEYDSYSAASAEFENRREEFDNLLIGQDDKVIRAEYGVILFHRDIACSYTIPCQRETDGRELQIDGCSAADALYVDTDETGERYLMMISGMKGFISTDDAELVPEGSISSALTTYTVNEGTLYHQIKTQMDTDLYSVYLLGGKAPAGLEEGETVRSYDGHYFYRDLRTLTDDVREGITDGAVNAGDPYYDYFQFLPHRSLSSYSVEDFEKLQNEIRGIHGAMDAFIDQNLDGMDDTVNRSQLYGLSGALIGDQHRYGCNALLTLGLSELESSYGRGYYAFTKNHLFARAAYDTDDESENGSYRSVVRSLYAHTKFMISGSFCSPLKEEYQGGFFGNLSSGMNSAYSSDPYWGEKAASFARQADLFLGKKDLSHYTIGIKTNDEKMQIYREASTSDGALYNSPASADYAVIILGEEGDYYKIQSDSTLTDQLTDISYDFDFSGDIGYVRKDEISHVETGSGTDDTPVHEIVFDAGEGAFSDGESTFAAYYRTGDIPAAEQPLQYHAVFAGWDEEPSAASEDHVYHAVYKNIESIEISSLPKQEYEINDRPDLKNGKLKVHYEDGTEEEQPLTSDMVSGFDLSRNGDQAVTVSWCGFITEYGIHVSAEQDALRNDIKTQIEEIIREYEDKPELEEEESARILAVKRTVDENFLPYLTQNQLRSFDRLVHRAAKERIILMVSENPVGFGISGVSLSLAENTSDQLVVCRINVTQDAPDEIRETVARTAAGNSYDLCGTVSFEIFENDEERELLHPVICSVSRPEGDPEEMVYRVYRYDENGDVTECYTRLSKNKISFMTDRSGQFFIASRLTSNVIDFEDPAETVTFETSDEMPSIEEIHPNFPYGMAALCVLGTIALFVLMRMIYLKFYRKKRRQERIDYEKEIKDLELTTMKLELGDIELWTETRRKEKDSD
jgi:hypothetical protein